MTQQPANTEQIHTYIIYTEVKAGSNEVLCFLDSSQVLNSAIIEFSPKVNKIIITLPCPLLSQVCVSAML